MSGEDIELDELLGPEPEGEEQSPSEVLLDETPAPASRPMGAASRALLERSRSYPVNRAAKKNTPERLQRLLNNIAEMPVISDACKRANISVSTLKYWLQKSKEGRPGDGFDVELGVDEETDDDGASTVRFHIAWDAAMEAGVGQVERAAFKWASEHQEVLTDRGRVIYQIDPEKYDLAVMLGDDISERNPALWLRDQYGAPIPETVTKMDRELAMFILKTRKSEVYGPKAQQVDVSVKGGVLVIPMRVQNSEDLNVLEGQYRREGSAPVVFEEDDEEDTSA